MASEDVSVEFPVEFMAAVFLRAGGTKKRGGGGGKG